MRRRHKTEFNYTKLTGKLLNLLRRAPSIGRPDKVTATWLSSVGFASSDPDSIIRVLRFVGLVGKPKINLNKFVGDNKSPHQEKQDYFC